MLDGLPSFFSGATTALCWYVRLANRCLMHVYCSFCGVLGGCNGNAINPAGGAGIIAATARYVSRTASGGRAALATAFFALSVRLVPRVCRAAMKSGDRDLKRATRACGFGLERLPWPGDGLFASACLDCYLARSARDSRAAAQIKLCLSRSHYQHAAGAEKL